MQTLRSTFLFIFALFLTVGLYAKSDPAQRTRLSNLPTAAQSNISATLGRDSVQYSVLPTADGLETTNPKQKLNIHFTRKAVEVRNGNARWRMTLRGYGYGDAVKLVPAVAPRANANRVEYRHGSLAEWYVNGPVGLEQGFSISQPPGERNGQPLVIALAMSGDLTAADRGNNNLTLASPDGKIALRYSGLAAYDASGKELRSWLELRGQRLLLKVADADARYPVVVDPWLQQAELTASDSQQYDHFGDVIAISGNTIVIGSDKSSDLSVLYVFVKPANGWTNMTETARLTESHGTAEDGFGTSVSISGNTIVAGVRWAMVGSNQFQGEALLFVKPASGWRDMKETARLTASDGQAFDYLGQSVSIAGNTVGIGAEGSNNTGAVYVFVRPTNGWKNMTQTVKLTASDAKSDDSLGTSVSVGKDTVVSGTVDQVGSNIEQGKAYVFVKPSGGWANMTQTAKLTASDGQAYDLLSDAISIDAAGDTVVAGAPGVGGYAHPGAAYVFVKPGSGWADMTETAKLTRHCGTKGCPQKGGMGFSVSITALGENVWVGAPSLTVGSKMDEGAVFQFVKPSGGWRTTSSPSREILAGDGTASDYFGTLAFSDGTLAVTSYGYNANHGNGVAYVFRK